MSDWILNVWTFIGMVCYLKSFLKSHHSNLVEMCLKSLFETCFLPQTQKTLFLLPSSASSLGRSQKRDMLYKQSPNDDATGDPHLVLLGHVFTRIILALSCWRLASGSPGSQRQDPDKMCLTCAQTNRATEAGRWVDIMSGAGYIHTHSHL